MAVQAVPLLLLNYHRGGDKTSLPVSCILQISKVWTQKKLKPIHVVLSPMYFVTPEEHCIDVRFVIPPDGDRRTIHWIYFSSGQLHPSMKGAVKPTSGWPWWLLDLWKVCTNWEWNFGNISLSPVLAWQNWSSPAPLRSPELLNVAIAN
jgi:hypothetical protein